MRKTFYLTENDAGHAIEMHIGDTLEITLDERGGTGRWAPEIKGEALRINRDTEHGYFLLTEDGHSVVHRFSAVSEGHAVLELRYENAHAVKPQDRFHIAVTVGNPPPLKRARLIIEPARMSQLAVWVFTALLVSLGLALAGFRMVQLGQNFDTSRDFWMGVVLALGGALLAGIFGVRLMGLLTHLSERDGRKH